MTLYLSLSVLFVDLLVRITLQDASSIHVAITGNASFDFISCIGPSFPFVAFMLLDITLRIPLVLETLFNAILGAAFWTTMFAG